VAQVVRVLWFCSLPWGIGAWGMDRFIFAACATVPVFLNCSRVYGK
jgi:hypothetical protein